ncbi:cobalt-precorrin-6A reductase [Thalassococcus sp. S3]|uniref:cobalt-precorrin-6A reductase n=1 Tax=Thalassococcus sp. S3 TaxID=2017482 RepID=UPI0010244F50|nr:cobalt-precorrin-6A reductase [Thalassococcus sp. S3]QBF30353.1 cobalt-precorrin-6A reductase [Thalassococcus sp. S3]
MQPNLLILGGTTEATALAKAVHEAGLRAIISFAGRVERPARQPLQRRIGGFGGVDGLARYLRAEQITHVIDATHPFAAQMSAHAVAACAQTGTALVALTRAPWSPQKGDNWQHVGGMDEALAALDRPARRVMLAVGRMHLDDFAPNPQHFYLLRLVDPPKTPPAFPDHHVLVSRGPFTADADRALMQRFDIDLVVSKNAGGTGAYAKIDAARRLGLPVLMIDRPAIPERAEVFSVAEAMDWIAHAGTLRGV